MMLSKLDELHRSDHYHLLFEDDQVLFLGEYTTGAGYQGGATNQHILNIKKKMDRKGKRDWPHKERSIRHFAAELRSALEPHRTSVE